MQNNWSSRYCLEDGAEDLAGGVPGEASRIKTTNTFLIVMNKLTSAQDAIKQAIEGGYKAVWLEGRYNAYAENVATLDPLFWQALGKVRGWEDEKVKHGIVYVFSGEIAPLERWKLYALRYFESLLSGGNEKKFWEELP